jgi:hypothetical protein
MVGRVRTLDRDLLVRRCVSCGYDGSLLLAAQAERCVRCGCDLRERPPRSYAEMEGLLGQPLSTDPVTADDADSFEVLRGREQRLVQRWLAFLFVVMLGLICLVCLSAEAFGV